MLSLLVIGKNRDIIYSLDCSILWTRILINMFHNTCLRDKIISEFLIWYMKICRQGGWHLVFFRITFWGYSCVKPRISLKSLMIKVEYKLTFLSSNISGPYESTNKYLRFSFDLILYLDSSDMKIRFKIIILEIAS